MAPRISLALAIHNHQPVGNFGWVMAEVYDLATALELDWYEHLGLCKKGGRSSELGNAFLKQRQRRIEVKLVVLQARRDRLQSLHAGFERHDSAPATAPGDIVD